MKALFLIYHGFDEANGICKKIRYQVKALKDCGMEVSLCYYEVDADGNGIWFIENKETTILRNLGKGFVSKLKKRFDMQHIADYVLAQGIEFVYMRSYHNANPFTIQLVKQMKRIKKVKVVMEIPTYPYDQEYISRRMKAELFVDRLFRHRLAAQTDGIVTFSNAAKIFGQHTIRISNGIDFDAIPLKSHTNNSANELHLIGVAEVHYWHGYDRLVQGLANYYRTQPEYKVYFHIVGNLTDERERREILPVINENKLSPYVILHGARHGAELNELFEKADFGIGSLARHRSGITYIKTLKNREYAARGLAFIYSEVDEDFEAMPYIIKAPADESPIDILRLVNFYRSLPCTPNRYVRLSGIYLGNIKCRKQLTQYTTMNKPLKIAFCIPALYTTGGMERVLTVKCNYFSEFFGYEIHIIITDGKNKPPHYPLHPSIIVHQLDINYDEMHTLPLHKRISGYLQRQRKFKKELDKCLNEIKPDITVSLLRREINFITKMTDGSIKLGEIHFSRYNYRDCRNYNLPAFIQRSMQYFWIKQLIMQLRHLDKFIVLTHEDAATWTELTNVMVIHNPLTIFPEQQSDCSNKRVIAAGRYTHLKGFDLLLSAWQTVAKRHPDWELHIYGSGNREELQQQAKNTGITSSCFLEPNATNITEKFLESSIFVLSSRSEGFGLVITEAMACGIPPVSFDCKCGPRDIINDGEDGLLVESGNVEQLADKICYLIENEDIRKEMGGKAHVSAERFKTEKIALQWKELFESLTHKE